MRTSGAGAIALLTGGRAMEPFVMLRALGDLEFTDIDLGAADTAGGAVVAVGSGWAERAHAEGVDVADVVIPRLRRAFDRVIGLDQETAAAVGFRPDVLHARRRDQAQRHLPRSVALRPPRGHAHARWRVDGPHSARAPRRRTI